MCDSSIDLQNFFPSKQLKIINVSESDTDIKIKLKSQNSSCICPKCNKISTKYHGTYTRKVQDL
ncbi:MAG: ISL3 family transposase, partial [Clostridium sp.]|nr:ISL3 family transposase [Clostridium sp.]